MAGREVVAVDFDETLTVNSSGPPDKISSASPRKSCVDKVNSWFDGGSFIVIWTARLEEDRLIIESWLKRNKVKFDLLITGKMRYDRFICDKAEKP